MSRRRLKDLRRQLNAMRNGYEILHGATLVQDDSSLSTPQWKSMLRSFDHLVLGFATAVVGRSFDVIRFFDFVTWLGHDFSSNSVFQTSNKVTNPGGDSKGLTGRFCQLSVG
jgi:hypothetical protein